MRIIIAGGRNYEDYVSLKRYCDDILSKYIEAGEIRGLEQCEVVSGLARGADLLGKRYALERNIKIKEFPANWNLYGKSAGYRRNREMLNYAKQENGILIAFWDGKSRGTENMITTSRIEGLKVFVYGY